MNSIMRKSTDGSKITEAEALLKKPTNRAEYEKYNINVDKSLKIYKDICLSSSFSNEDKVLALCSLFKALPEEGIDLLNRLRDALTFLKDEEESKHIDLLRKITKSSAIGSYERLATIVCLYNHFIFYICYECFADFACDTSALIEHRVDACRYLFASGEENFKQITQDCLIGILETVTYPSEYRYKIIAGYISKTGIATYLNSKKLRVAYDEVFVYGLQHIFFYNEANGVEERVLSGQHMLGMEIVEKDEKEQIGNILLEIANNRSLTENLRADAADVVLRMGTTEQSKSARIVISQLGYAAVDSSQENTLISKSKTIYTNSQNVHDEKITSSVNIFIEKIIGEAKQKPRPYHEVHREVVDMIKSRKLVSEKRIAALRSLNRISIDTAVFSKLKVNIAEIFVHVWLRILGYDDKDRKFLEDRLIQELVEMSDNNSSKCSSGHASRLINVLAIFEVELSISWSDQIKSNIVGRMNALIRDCKDPDMKASLCEGMTKDADESDKKIYKNFIETNSVHIKEEMYKEFVEGGYLNESDFEKDFQAGLKLLL